mmetsp:Transcript_9515/g.22423  ORF Transcript_9515/g.22423 Transcript_9515/m.22423 type:complete len:271 (+) Transcript_9515:19-831(+)
MFILLLDYFTTLKERGHVGGVLWQSPGLEDHGGVQRDDETARDDVGPEPVLDDLGDRFLPVGRHPLVDGAHGLALRGEVGGTPPRRERREDVEHHGDVGRGDAQAAVAGDGQARAREHGQGQPRQDQRHVEEGDLVEVEGEDGGLTILDAQPLQRGRHDDAAAEQHATQHVSREEYALGNRRHEGRPRTDEVVGEDEAGQAEHPDGQAGQFHHLGVRLPVLLVAGGLQGLERHVAAASFVVGSILLIPQVQGGGGERRTSVERRIRPTDA